MMGIACLAQQHAHTLGIGDNRADGEIELRKREPQICHFFGL